MFKHVTFMFLKVIKSAEEHIELVHKERAHFHECLKHIKFSSDWCFGLFKWHFQRSRVGCLDDNYCESGK